LRSRARKAVTLLGGTAFSLFDGTPHYGDQPGVQGAVVGGGSGLGALVQIVGQSQVHMLHGIIVMLRWSHVEVSDVPHAAAGAADASALRARPVRVEPRCRTAVVLASGPQVRARVRRAVPPAHRGPRRVRLAARRV